ncbi:MAG TPA: peptidoglycan-binding protein [Candidatus Paceibacterota bacterium]|nr:peptidoglycan-binding protein [Candidatus Paceibacterota bacterium]
MLNAISKIGLVVLAAVIGAVAVLGFAPTASAQFAQTTQCVFTRDLFLGAFGEDVRCLQRYLNASGYPVAYTGAGSYGREGYSFGPLTQAAVARWQAATGQQVTGVFRVSALAGNPSNPFSNTPIIDTRNSNRNRSNDADRRDAREAIDDAREAIDDARDDISDARRANKNVRDAEDLLDEARDDLKRARRAYNDGDYDDAVDFADDAEENAEDAVDEIGSSSTSASEANARRAIEEADDAIDDAWEEIDDADDDGEDVDDAEDLLDEAEDEYEDALDAFDRKDYRDAIDHAEEAEELADDAVDEIDD